MSKKIIIAAPFIEKHVNLIRAAAGSDFTVEQVSWDIDNELMKIALKDAVVVVGQPPIEMLQDPAKDFLDLRLIQMTWAGTDEYTRSNLPFPVGKIQLANASGAYGMVISQFVVGQILSIMLNFKEYHRQQETQTWEQRGPIKSLDGANVMIFGAGNIGSMTAKRLRGFDVHAIGVCRDTSKKREFFDELCTLEEAERNLPRVDVVICCIPNSKETEGFMNDRRLGLMKKGAIIVNVGRGNFIDCNALDAHLRSGHLWGAALDVTNPEPLPKDHPLWSNPRCFITPHASGVFEHLERTERMICEIACENILRVRDHREIKNRVY